MHPYKRSTRLGELLLTEISAVMARHLKDPRIGFATVTRVALSDDLRHAKVFVSILGSEQDKARTLQGLSSATGYLRRHLGQALHLRYTPELTFLSDTSLEHGANIAQLLRQLQAG